MSTESIQKIIGRAAIEPQFRALLFRDPAQAMAGYELNDVEATSLRHLSPEAFDSVVSDLEVRVSRTVTNLSKSGSDSQKAVTPPPFDGQ